MASNPSRSEVRASTTGFAKNQSGQWPAGSAPASGNTGAQPQQQAGTGNVPHHHGHALHALASLSQQSAPPSSGPAGVGVPGQGGQWAPQAGGGKPVQGAGVPTAAAGGQWPAQNQHQQHQHHPQAMQPQTGLGALITGSLMALSDTAVTQGSGGSTAVANTGKGATAGATPAAAPAAANAARQDGTQAGPAGKGTATTAATAGTSGGGKKRQRSTTMGDKDEQKKATRREQNRHSAQQFRRRKKEYVSNLELQITQLQQQISDIRSHTGLVIMSLADTVKDLRAKLAKTSHGAPPVTQAEIQAMQMPHVHRMPDDGSMPVPARRRGGGSHASTTAKGDGDGDAAKNGTSAGAAASGSNGAGDGASSGQS